VDNEERDIRNVRVVALVCEFYGLLDELHL
jgi:hypothetical protein